MYGWYITWEDGTGKLGIEKVMASTISRAIQAFLESKKGIIAETSVRSCFQTVQRSHNGGREALLA